MPLRRKLPLAFAGVALLTILVLGGVLIPLLSNHYSRAQTSYLQAGAQEAAQQLSGVAWSDLAVQKNDAATTAALRQVRAVALSTQLRIEVFDSSGALLADSGPVSEIDPTTLAAAVAGGQTATAGSDAGPAASDGRTERHSGGQSRHLPSLVGSGLFDRDGAAAEPYSSQTVATPLVSGGKTVATIRLSEVPAYGATVLHTTVIAWLVAAAAAVLLGALAGWMTSRHLTRPLLAITRASNKMAGGDLGVRADVRRADEIGDLAASFNSMADTTQHTFATLRRFIADAAHELGTPLTALQADLELAQDQQDEDTRRRLVDRALKQSRRLERLSSDLLRLSRLDLGARRPAEPTDLVPLTQRLAEGFASRAEQAGVDFVLELPPDPLVVGGNPEELRTAVGNLVDNALKFTPAGGSVTLAAAADDGEAVVSVDDTGIGVPSEDVDLLFSRFHRGRNASGYPGSGLGLAIVRAIADSHGGKATVHSSASGSRFELRLPLAGVLPSG
jgi:two-component system, OmpR family, sensor histidine kinase BaeS